MGFRDVDFLLNEDANQVLIQTYGDSFTEGDGAPADSAYPALLKWLVSNENVTIQNFGIMGSDPGFYWMQMKEIGIKLRPDIAVITYSTIDLTTDFFTRGGLERFKNGYYSGFAPPKWEWLYGYSYLFRLFANSLFGVSYNNFFLAEEQKQQRLKSLEKKWNETFTAIAGIAQKNNIRILLIKKPERSEVDLNKYNYDFNFFEKMADTIPVFKRCDLLPFYRDSMGINSSNSVKYYWPKDGHHNSTGYGVMAQGVYAGLKQAYPEIFSKLDSAKAKE
jgi:lysophospholipase L1-like esterase